MTTIHTPWHTLTVSEVWYCDQAVPDAAQMPCRDEDGWCTGHQAAASGTHVEVEHDLTHPADCESLPDFLDCLTADFVCDDRTPLPSVPGSYRVRTWMQVPGEQVEGPVSGIEWLGFAGGAS